MSRKPNTGTINRNEYKKEDRHPDYRGTIDVDGKEKEISLWINEGKDGKKYFYATIKEPYKKQEAPKRNNDDNDFLNF